jgi:translation initiation factor IF-2
MSDPVVNDEKKLKILLKTDSNGSLEAILPILKENDRIEVVSSGIGSPTESDVYMAKITASVIIAFRTQVPKQTESLAEVEKVVIKSYSIIYELLDELSEVADLLYEKEHKQKMVRGEATVQALFVIEGNKVSGVKLTKGKIGIGDQVELIRGTNIIASGRVISLRIRARGVKEIKKGEEGGVCFDPVLDVRVGDMIKSYSI